MLPKTHFVAGLIVSIILYFIFPNIGIFNLVVFVLATVLIDIDHYLYYVWRKRDWSLKRAFLWFMKTKKVWGEADRARRKEYYSAWYFLHGIEFVGLNILLGYFLWDIFYFVGLGLLLHLILDWIYHVTFMDRFDRLFCVYDYFKFKKLKQLDVR